MGKSSYHRSENKFKFQSFHQRLANVNIDVIHRIKYHDDTPESNSTFFGEALDKWTELNCTRDFTLFRREISENVQNFTQLVHHQDEIVSALKVHLLKPNSLALAPLLDLLVQLARDLQKDFYKHFKVFFELLVELLNSHSHDTEVLEQLFSALSYLFKFLWRYLVQDMKTVYEFYSPLFSESYKSYIRSFAAESFAFLMRKCKDHSRLFDTLFKSHCTTFEKLDGLGQLFFEMIKGVKSQFHSCTEKVLPILLGKLGICQERKNVKKLKWKMVERALKQTFTAISEYTDKANALMIWDLLLTSLRTVYTSWQSAGLDKADLTKQLVRLLRLAEVMIEHARGRIVTQPDTVATLLIDLISDASLPTVLVNEVIKTQTQLLKNCHANLSMAVSAKLINRTYLVKDADEVLGNFTIAMLKLPLFEKDVLPAFLLHVSETFGGNDDNKKSSLLDNLREILVTKYPFPQDGSSIENLTETSLDFKKSGEAVLDFLVNRLNEWDIQDIKNLKQIWTPIICLPYLKLAVKGKEKATSCLSEFLTTIFSALLSLPSEETSKANTYLEVIYNLVCGLIFMTRDSPGVLWSHVALSRVTECLRKHGDNLYALRTADLFFTVAQSADKMEFLEENVLLEIFEALESNLSSHDSQKRLLTLRICNQFTIRLPVVSEEVEHIDSVFQICLSAELVPLTVQDYRQRMIYLQKLEYDVVQNCIPDGPFKEVPLRYLIGSLFVNFKLLWEPITKLIATHAHGLSRNQFWNVFHKELLHAADMSEKQLLSEDLDLDDATSIMDKSRVMVNKKADFINFRYHMWKTMQLFSDLCETKTRDLSPLLFRFLSNEYYLTDSAVAHTQNIRKKGPSGKPLKTSKDSAIENVEHSKGNFSKDSVMEDDGSQDVVEEQGSLMEDGHRKSCRLAARKRLNTCGEEKENVEKEKKTDTQKKNDAIEEQDIEEDEEEEAEEVYDKKKRRAASSTLVVLLELFSKFKNPKSVYMDPQLKELYLKFLSHNNPEVQNVAFKCYLTYKEKFLLPYKENFERLLDDKTFKSELVLFSVDHEEGQIKPQHRDELLSILMRVLYGKMQAKVKKGSSNPSNIRQAFIFRFLAGCHTAEIKTFMDMVFLSFNHFITDKPHEMVIQVIENVQLEKMIPLRKILGTLHSVSTIMKKIGHRVTDFLPSMLSIVLGLSAVCSACLEQRENISAHNVSLLKKIRQLATNKICQIFEDFDDYMFSHSEIEAVFHAVIYPRLDKLRNEGIYHPTALLKLLIHWAKTPRYNLLLTHKDGDSDLPLAYVFQLLNHKDVHSTVSAAIMEMVDILFNPVADGEENVKVKPLTTNNSVQVTEELPTVRDLGLQLMSPHVPAVLQYLTSMIPTLKARLKKKSSTRDLSIMARISDLVTDKEQSLTLVNLLLPYLDKGIPRSLEAEHNILSSINNLIKQIKDKGSFFRPLCPLFSVLDNRHSRQLLCNIISQVICDLGMTFPLSRLLEDLNSWDPKRMDEPNYTRRIGAFKEVNAIIKNLKSFDIDFLLPLIYNCCYFIKKIDDLSIRDNSTHCMVEMVQRFSDMPFSQEEMRILVTQGLLIEVKQGLRDKAENIRHECVVILSKLVEVFPADPAFAGMHSLHDEDIEKDFFENIRHIQPHRRAKALRRLTHHVNDHPTKKEQIVSYYLPLSSCFLLDNAYTKHQGLQEAAVDAMGALCRKLPWQQYLHQLKYYLMQLNKHLDKQKLMIRVIVTILDAFHFDLQQSEFVSQNLPSSVSKRKAAGLPTEETHEETEGIGETESKKDAETEAETSELDGNEKEEEEGEVKGTEDVVESQQTERVLSIPVATKIHSVIVQNLIPQLHKCLTEKIQSEEEHKAARSKYAEDTEILRVPLALAMVKLLQKLPHKSVEHSLPGILLKVCNFLKSRSLDIRTSARTTLTKIVHALGCRYFPFVVSEMRTVLRRGYQLHVLCFTVNMLLKEVLPQVKPGELDVCRESLQEVFNEDIFGTVAEEKDVEGITSKLMEARSVKSFDSYQMLAQCIGTKSLIPLITPLKEQLDTTQSQKVSKKVNEVFKKIVFGLLENPGIDTQELMQFSFGIVSDMFPQLSDKEEKSKTAENKDKVSLRKESCLLLPITPSRGGEKPKHSKKTNINVIIEFGLELLHQLLKKGRLTGSKTEHLKLIDPFVPILQKLLYSKHVKINSLCLRCFGWILKYELPSLPDNIISIAKGIFILLRNYAASNTSGGDNLELVTMCFKTVTVLVRDVKCYMLNTEQLQVLLTFCEEDLHNFNRQTSAFSLLKAILSRKLNNEQLSDLMKNVRTLAITSESAHVRRECRQLTLHYMMEYPLEKQLIKYLEFFLIQLNYELDIGRESALEMLATVFSSFPKVFLGQHAGFFFIPMAAAMINDESLKCRKLTALGIKSLLSKLNDTSRKELFLIATKWLKDTKLKHRILGAQTCGLFPEVEGENFQRNLPEIFPFLIKNLEPTQYDKYKGDQVELEIDQLLYNCLSTLIKILSACNIVRTPKYNKYLNPLWEYSRSHLLSGHTWVRLASCQLFGFLFGAWGPEELIKESQKPNPANYICINMLDKMEALASDMIQQLQSQYLNEELANQVVKNLVFIAKVSKLLRDDQSFQGNKTEDTEGDNSDHDEDEDENGDGDEAAENKMSVTKKDKGKRLSLPWLVRKLVREANHEAVSKSKVTLKRSSVFKWIAAISLDVETEVLHKICHILIGPLQREIRVNSDESLRLLAEEVVSLLKRKLGVEDFTAVFTSVQKKRFQRKDARKQQRAVESVANPEIAAKRRLKKNLLKKEAKKRKIEDFKPYKKFKKLKQT